MTDFEFTIASEYGLVSIEGGDAGLIVSQVIGDDDPDREPGDHDVIHMTIAEARELHRKLGEALTPST